MAEATLAWMLGLTHHVRTKDRLVREGRWHDRNGYMGCELRERTLGIVGFGGIGRTLVQLLVRLRHEPAAGVRPVPGRGHGRRGTAPARSSWTS